MRWNEILACSFRAMPSGETTTHKVEFLKEKYLMVMTFWGEVLRCMCVCVCGGGGGVSPATWFVVVGSRSICSEVMHTPREQA